MNIESRFRRHQLRLEKRLAKLLPPATLPPRTLHRAMRYSVLNGGKRIRPILCLEAAHITGGKPAGLDDLACAVECIHTYSLIHDDLPALDNDDLRRGRLTCHKKFGEATAILAGDALLTLAFEITSNLRGISPSRRNSITATLARAAGTRVGMIGGQMADLDAEGRRVTAKQLERIHRGKTGALITAAVTAGAHYAGASRKQILALTRFGENLGLAFQIVDDLLEVQGSTSRLGKAAHKDAARGKATYPAVHGVERSERAASSLIRKATTALRPFGDRAKPRIGIALYVLHRAT